MVTKTNEEIAYFGAGCFWGIEEVFRTTDGVSDTRVGYMGGTTKNPTYEQVCSDTTGHIEAVKVVYDPQKVSFKTLVELFWTIHDPTAVDHQGPDYGTQYRSAIFYTTQEQKEVAEKSKKDLIFGKRFSKPITTEIRKAPAFYEAEEYHQRYLQKTGRAVCH